jgi:FtsZ-binding cell division protein ZapB
MDAAIHDVDALYSENERLKAEVDKSEAHIRANDNMIKLAEGLAKENTSLHNTCQTLVDENSRLKQEAQISQEKLQSREEEISQLHEEGYGPYLWFFVNFLLNIHQATLRRCFRRPLLR